jgi:hypothetical protein
MMKNLVGALILFVSLVSFAQSVPQRLPADRLEGPPMAEVLVLGTYHMDNPGRDIFNMEADDVLAPKRQAEIRELLDVLTRFRPTKIAIEADSDSPKIKQYQDYAKAHGREKELESLMAQAGKAVQDENEFLRSHSVLQMLLRMNSSEAVKADPTLTLRTLAEFVPGCSTLDVHSRTI